MPPVFAQPSPIPRFSSSYGGGGGGSYAALASIVQQRYAADADRYARSQFGAAQLDEQARQHDNEMAMRAAQMRAQSAMQDNAIAGELVNFGMKQRFTIQDQQELAKQENATSEILDKLNSGDITQAEAYKYMSNAAPRISFLKAKQEYTKNQILNEQRQAQTEAFKTLAEQRDQANAYQRAQLAGQLDIYIPPQYQEQVSKVMRDGYPGLQPGSPEYDEQRKAVASELGIGLPFAKDSKGLPVYQKDLPSFAGGGMGGGRSQSSSGSGGGRGDVKVKAAEMANDFYKNAIAPPSEEEWSTKAKQFESFLSGSGEKSKAMESYKASVGAREVDEQQWNKRTDISDYEKNVGSKILQEWRRLAKEYPSGQPIPRAVAKRMAGLIDQFKAMQDMVSARQSYYQPRQGQLAAPGGAAPVQDQQGNPPSQPLRSDRPVMSSQITPAESVGNAYRNLRDIVSDSAPSSDALRRVGPAVKSQLDELGRILDFIPEG